MFIKKRHLNHEGGGEIKPRLQFEKKKQKKNSAKQFFSALDKTSQIYDVSFFFSFSTDGRLENMR